MSKELKRAKKIIMKEVAKHGSDDVMHLVKEMILLDKIEAHDKILVQLSNRMSAVNQLVEALNQVVEAVEARVTELEKKRKKKE